MLQCGLEVRKWCTLGLLSHYTCCHKYPAKARYSLFMEPPSENRQRGRPRAFSERELSDAGGRSALSLRHLQNRAYAQQAQHRLTGLWWWEDISKGRPPIPQCVLTELGRIEDSAKFQEAAWWYAFSARGLAAKTAAAKIKQMRTGKTPQEGPVTLYMDLMKVIEDFRLRYPYTSLQYVEGQVKLALDTVRRS
jgi:hypothetical protein